ncbi:MAG: DUF1302 family protein [Candidatus Binatia bacterium]
MGMKTFRAGQWLLALLVTFGIARTAAAIYLDEDQQISLRARLYSQTAIRTEGSFGDTTPVVEAGRVVQQRNFFNPELDAKLASYTAWMKDMQGFLPVIAPDSFDFRLAGWGFYDGIYDYGTQQFNRQLSRVKTRFSEATSLTDVLNGNDDVLDPRDVYAHQQRVNELYLSYTKGPLFIRVGRQAISWGESDTIGILDQNNPFDITVAAPGIFEDLDEARIPLWTLRTSYALFDSLGPFSSGFVEGYWVPGDIDNTTAIVPMQTLSPYSAPGKDPGDNPLLARLGNPPFYFVDHVPTHSMGNSRWGVRAQTVVARDYTVSAWIYTTFPNAPVPRLVGRAYAGRFHTDPRFILEMVHQLVPVIGVSNTFFFQPLNGIVRMEAEYFNREPAFIPQQNLPTDLPTIICPNGPTGTGCIPKGGTVPHADFLRWELGFDRFFFFRPINPSNSFTWVTAMVGQYNLDETSKKDFYAGGPQKAGTSGQNPTDFIQLQKVEVFFQSDLTTDFMHGRLSPSLLGIVNVDGAHVVQPQVLYRWTDSLFFNLSYTYLGGMLNGQTGQFRDRDQLAMRATYQLN